MPVHCSVMQELLPCAKICSSTWLPISHSLLLQHLGALNMHSPDSMDMNINDMDITDMYISGSSLSSERLG